MGGSGAENPDAIKFFTEFVSAACRSGPSNAPRIGARPLHAATARDQFGHFGGHEQGGGHSARPRGARAHPAGPLGAQGAHGSGAARARLPLLLRCPLLHRPEALSTPARAHLALGLVLGHCGHPLVPLVPVAVCDPERKRCY